MSGIKSKVDYSKLNLSTKNVDMFVEKTLNRASNELKNSLVNNTPSKTGKAKSNWNIIKNKDNHIVTNSSHYLKWVNDGTGIYGKFKRRIFPRRARVLAFKWKGRMWFLKSVKGQKPQKFVERSIESTQKKIDGVVIKSARETL